MSKGIIRAASAVVLAMGIHVSAVPVSWDGNGSPDADGDWSVADNWDDGDGLTADAVPTSADTVTLPSVGTGTRTITQDITGGTTVTSLTLEQSTAGAVNALTLNGDLSITQTRGYVVSLSGDATAADVVLNLNGHQLRLTTALSNSNVTLSGTLNLTSAESAVLFAYEAGSNDRMVIDGVVNVDALGGEVRIGRHITSRNQSAGMTVEVAADALIDIAAGRLYIDQYAGPSQGYPSNGVDNLSVTNNGTINLHGGAALQMGWNHTVSNGSDYDNVSFTNGVSDSMRHGGALEFRVFRDPAALSTPTTTLTNNGVWTIEGSGATIKRMSSVESSETNPAISIPTLTNNSAGILIGSASNDGLEFDEELADGTRRMTITNNGQIAPGDGTNGAGTASVGSLALRDIDVTFGATGRLNVDVGGTSAGEYDVLALETGSTDPAGAGTLDLSAAGDRLNVTLVNSFAPGGDFAIPILTYGTVTGEFDILAVNGLTDNAATWSDGVGVYSVSYGGGSANLMYTVPEPGTAGLIATAGLALLRRRRRPA